MNRTVLISMIALISLSLISAFNVNHAHATLMIYIWDDGTIVPSGVPITTSDNVTYSFTDDISGSITVERSNITVNGNGHILEGDGTGSGFTLLVSDNVTIQNTRIRSFDWAIYMDGPTQVTIANNTITNSIYGILFYRSQRNRIIDNTVSNNKHGVFLSYSSSSNTIENNNITANQLDGIKLWAASHNNTLRGNSITGNNLTANEPGIMLSYASDCNIIENDVRSNYFNLVIANYSARNKIIRNNITRSNVYGIYLYDSTTDNVIYANDVSENEIYGINIRRVRNCTIAGNNITKNQEGIALYYSNNNTFYHNNLIDNTIHVSFHTNCSDLWDNGAEGNFWSNYTGHDSTNDGIGETPHIINEINRDDCPLMGMFCNFKVTVEQGKVDNVQVISNSTVKDLMVAWWLSSPNPYLQPGDKFLILHVEGETDTAGFCKITIPRKVFNGTYTVLVDWNPIQATESALSNSTHASLYFTYEHTEHEIIVTPEFQGITFALLLSAITIMSMVTSRRRNLSKPTDDQDST